jgi:hypothetical protein
MPKSSHQQPCLSYRPFTSINPFFFIDWTIQAKKDVTGASNPHLADPEKKGEGIKDSAKIVVSCFTSVFKSGDGFVSSQAALLSNMGITFMISDIPAIIADYSPRTGHCGP